MSHLNNNRTRSGILVLTLLLLTVFLASCKDDDPVAPVVTNHAPTVPAIDTASGAPADGATDIALTAQLHWTCTDPDNDPLTYDVHFGTVAQPPVVEQDQTAASYTPSGLVNGITYYWQIAASDDGGKTTTSPIWSFTTLTVAGETVSTPDTPTGLAMVETNVPSDYTTAGAVSSEGHVIEYRFDWGDGAMAGWGAGSNISHTWTAAGSYDVKAQARCAVDTDVESVWSAALTVTVLDSETVSTPNAPTGPATGEIQEILRYDLSGAECSWGHTVEYQIDWGDAQMTSWSVNTFGVHSYSTPGTYEVKTQARCQEHPTVESAWSAATTVIISSPAEVVSAPTIGGNNPSIGGINDLLEFNIMPGVSNLGHPTEVQIDWGDGTFSDWGPEVGMYYTRSHAWAVAGTYQVKAHARCIEHPEYESDWSQPKSVEITAVETISTPITSPSGEVTLNLGGWLSPKVLSGAVSNMGHAVEYQWDWGNGTMSTWSPSSNSVMPTDVAGDFQVRVYARCIEHPDVESEWSEILLVHIVDLETISQPVLSGPSMGAVGELLTFTVSGAESSLGHALEYQLWWSAISGYTNIPLGWTTADNLTATFDQPYSGGVTIQVQARCIEHPDVESIKSAYKTVIITP